MLTLNVASMAVSLHHHSAYQVVFTTAAPFNATLGADQHTGIEGFVIAPDVPHACSTQDTEVWVINVDPHSADGRKLRHQLGGQPYRLLTDILPGEILASQKASLRAFGLRSGLPLQLAGATPAKGRAGIQLSKIAGNQLGDLLIAPPALAAWPEGPEQGPKCFLAAVAGKITARQAPSIRVLSILQWLPNVLHRPVLLGEAAERAHVSADRFRHQFFEEVGMAYSQYLLYARIKRALDEVAHEGHSLAEAALNSGFTDQAHFTRRFRRMFGVPPSVLLEHSRYIQVEF